MSEILFARLDELNAAIAGITSHGTFFAPTFTGVITLTPVYQSTNPGNAGVYGLIGNSPVGSTTIYNALQVSQGVAIPATQQFRSNTVGVQQAIVGTTQNLAGDLTTYHLAGGAFYALTNQAAGIGIAATVGVFGQGMTNVANASVFGGNVVAMNSNGIASAFGFDMNYIVGLEIDVNMSQKVGNINPTASSGHVYGLIIAGDSTLTAPITGSSAVAVDRLSVNTNVPWYYGFSTYDNAAVIGIGLGAAGTGNNVNSQPIQMSGRNAGGNIRTVDIHGDANGALLMSPDTNSGLTAILNGIGGTALVGFSSAYGNGNMNINGLAVAGVLTNTSAGSVISTTSLSTTLGGLGANNSASNGVPLFAAGVVTITATSGTGSIARVASPTFTGTITSAAISNSGNIASATFNNVIITTPGSTATFTLGTGKTVSIANSLTFTGTDSSSVAFGTGGTVFYSGAAAGGDLAGTYPNPTITNASVIAKVLTGYTAGAGTVAATDSILQAIQKLGGLVGNAAWTAYTASLAAQTNGVTPPTLTLNAARYVKFGKTVIAAIDFTVTAAGTGSGYVSVGLPFPVVNNVLTFSGSATEYAALGIGGWALASPNATVVNVKSTVAATPFIVTGQAISVVLKYETT